MSKPSKDTDDAVITRKVPFPLNDTEVAMKAKTLVDIEMEIEAEEVAKERQLDIAAFAAIPVAPESNDDDAVDGVHPAA